MEQSFRILIPEVKDFSKDKFSIHYGEEYNLKVEEGVRSKIDSIWDEKVKEAESQGRKPPFNGTKFRFCDLKNENDNVALFLGMSDYKEHVGTTCQEHTIDDNSAYANILGNMVILETNDNQIVFIKRSEDVNDYPGYLDVPGGHPEPSKIKNFTEEEILEELFNSAKDEVVAEINLSEDDVGDFKCLGFIENLEFNYKPDMIFYIKLNISKEEVLELYKKGGEEQFESTNIVFIPVSEIKNRLEIEKLTPASLASLALYLR